MQRLAAQLDVDIEDLATYQPPERTEREHHQLAALLALFRDPDVRGGDDIEDLLVEHALEHDSPLALLSSAAIMLRDRQVLRPGISTLQRLVTCARARAERETHERLKPVLDAARGGRWTRCVTDVRLGVSRLVWLGQKARSASPAQIVGPLEKLAFLRELGAPDWQLQAVSCNRRCQLAVLARRSTTAALVGRLDRLRYPRAAVLLPRPGGPALLDEILDRADQAVGEAHGQALRELKAQTATAANQKVALFDLLVGLLLDDSVADDEVRTRAWKAMAPQCWAAAREQAQAIPTAG